MAAPAVHPSTRRLYDSLGSGFTREDESSGWQLLRFVESFGVEMGVVDDIVRDSDDGPGWSVVFDIDRVPIAYLPFLAQFIGVRIGLSNLSDAEKRARVKNAEGFKRGTRPAMIQAAKSLLTGTKRVKVLERFEGNANAVRVQTYLAETPDAPGVEAEVRKQKPAGLILTHQVLGGATYGELSAEFATYPLLDAGFTDYADMEDHVPA